MKYNLSSWQSRLRKIYDLVFTFLYSTVLCCICTWLLYNYCICRNLYDYGQKLWKSFCLFAHLPFYWVPFRWEFRVRKGELSHMFRRCCVSVALNSASIAQTYSWLTPVFLQFSRNSPPLWLMPVVTRVYDLRHASFDWFAFVSSQQNTEAKF